MTPEEICAFLFVLAEANEQRAQDQGDMITVRLESVLALAPNTRRSLVRSMRTLRSMTKKMGWQMWSQKIRDVPNVSQLVPNGVPVGPQVDPNWTPDEPEPGTKRPRARDINVTSVTILIRNWSEYQGFGKASSRSLGDELDTSSPQVGDVLDTPTPTPTPTTRKTPQTPRGSPNSKPEPEPSDGKIPLAKNLAAVLASDPDAADKLKSILDGANAGAATTDERGEIVDRLPVELGCKPERWESLRPLILERTAALSLERLRAACETFASDPKRGGKVPSGAEILDADSKLQRAAIKATRERTEKHESPFGAQVRGLGSWLREANSSRTAQELVSGFDDCSARTLFATLRTIKPDAEASIEQEIERIRLAAVGVIIDKRDARKSPGVRKAKRGNLSKLDIDKWISGDAMMNRDAPKDAPGA